MFFRNVGCNDSASFCGIRDQLYPDKRSMGYPFDRTSRQDAQTLRDFVTPNSNMAVAQVQIRFTNTIVNKS